MKEDKVMTKKLLKYAMDLLRESELPTTVESTETLLSEASALLKELAKQEERRILIEKVYETIKSD